MHTKLVISALHGLHQMSRLMPTSTRTASVCRLFFNPVVRRYCMLLQQKSSLYLFMCVFLCICVTVSY